MKLDARKRVFGYPFVGKREVCNLLQTLHVADDRILLTGLFRFEVELKGTYQFTIGL